MKRDKVPLMVKGIVSGLFQIILLGAVIIVPAGLIPGGRWIWGRALVFLAGYGVLLEGAFIAMAIKAPASLEARMKPPLDKKKQPMADFIVTSMLMAALFCWCVLIPIDSFLLRLFPMPGRAVLALGGVVFVIGFVIVIAAIFQNSFAIPNVQDQSDRGQVLVDSGLYGIVRHPFYTGLLMWLVGTALWFGSYVSVIAIVPVLLILIARISIEERMLRATLAGYSQYVARVRYRLIPFIW